MGATLMSDQEILLAIEDGELKVDPLSQDDKNLHRKDASIQPSSLDLRVGRILIPDADTDIMDTQVARKWRLGAGHSAVIETRETVTMSANISGFGFPPAHLAAKGLLVTNPGHVDPGYSGTLRLTVINMGRKEILLEEGLEIISLLLFRFAAPNELSVLSDYTQRRRSQETTPRDDRDAVSVLSPDFGNFSKRVEDSAKQAAEDAFQFKTQYIDWIKWAVPVIAVALAGAVTWVMGELPGRTSFASESEIDSRIEILKNEFNATINASQSDIAQLQRQLDLLRNTSDALRLDERFDALENAISGNQD